MGQVFRQVPRHLVVQANDAIGSSGVNELELHQTATGALMAAWDS